MQAVDDLHLGFVLVTFLDASSPFLLLNFCGCLLRRSLVQLSLHDLNFLLCSELKDVEDALDSSECLQVVWQQLARQLGQLQVLEMLRHSRVVLLSPLLVNLLAMHVLLRPVFLQRSHDLQDSEVRHLLLFLPQTVFHKLLERSDCFL